MDLSSLKDGKLLELVLTTAIAQKAEGESSVDVAARVSELIKKLGPDGLEALSKLLGEKKPPGTRRREYVDGKRLVMVFEHPDGTTETTSFPIPIWDQ